MQQKKVWTFGQKVMAGFIFALCIQAGMSLLCGNICGSRVNAHVANQVGMSSIDTAAGVYAHRNGDTIKALFLTLRSDGTETLVSRDITEDPVSGFLDTSMPAWRLNDGLSLFFEVPVYERELSFVAQMDARVPV